MTTYTYQTIDPPGSTYTIANSINSSGQIVGSDSSGGFLDNNGIYTILIGSASDINSSGQIVGTDGTAGFLYSGGTYTTIVPPGINHVNGPLYINKTGQIVGNYLDGNGVYHGFLYSHGTYTTLNYPGAADTYAL